MLRGTVEQQAGEGHIQRQASRCSGLAQQGGCNAGPGRQTKWDLGSRMLFEGAEKGSQEVKGQGPVKQQRGSRNVTGLVAPPPCSHGTVASGHRLPARPPPQDTSPASTLSPPRAPPVQSS